MAAAADVAPDVDVCEPWEHAPAKSRSAAVEMSLVLNTMSSSPDCRE